MICFTERQKEKQAVSHWRVSSDFFNSCCVRCLSSLSIWTVVSTAITAVDSQSRHLYIWGWCWRGASSGVGNLTSRGVKFKVLTGNSEIPTSDLKWSTPWSHYIILCFLFFRTHRTPLIRTQRLLVYTLSICWFVCVFNTSVWIKTNPLKTQKSHTDTSKRKYWGYTCSSRILWGRNEDRDIDASGPCQKYLSYSKIKQKLAEICLFPLQFLKTEVDHHLL